jgi:hypothetical protein
MTWKKGERIPTNVIVGFLRSGKTSMPRDRSEQKSAKRKSSARPRIRWLHLRLARKPYQLANLAVVNALAPPSSNGAYMQFIRRYITYPFTLVFVKSIIAARMNNGRAFVLRLPVMHDTKFKRGIAHRGQFVPLLQGTSDREANHQPLKLWTSQRCQAVMCKLG